MAENSGKMLVVSQHGQCGLVVMSGASAGTFMLFTAYFNTAGHSFEGQQSLVGKISKLYSIVPGVRAVDTL